MTSTSDAIVIGGGLHGLSAALQLLRRGLKVTLLERSRVGRHASGASAAGVRTLARDRAELPASLAAMSLWHNIEDLVGDDCGFRANGQLKVAESQAELDVLTADVERLQSDGFFHEEIIGAAELADVVPAIAPHCTGAIYARNDGAADPHRTLAAFLSAALSAGLQIREGLGVTHIEKRGGCWNVGDDDSRFEAPLLVNAAGAWADKIAVLAGDIIPLGATKASMMLVTERAAPFIDPTVGAAGRKLSFKQTLQGTVLIGGGFQGRPDLVAETSELDGLAMAHSAAEALAIFPRARHLRVVRAWAGIEANSIDGVAIAGLSPSQSGLMHLFGFTGHGFQLVPILGIVTADLLVDGQTSIDVAGLSPRRLMAK